MPRYAGAYHIGRNRVESRRMTIKRFRVYSFTLSCGHAVHRLSTRPYSPRHLWCEVCNDRRDEERGRRPVKRATTFVVKRPR